MDKYQKRQQLTLNSILRPLEQEYREWVKEDKLNWYEKHLEINTAVYLRYLAANALMVGFAEFMDADRLEQMLGEGYTRDNTYNYNEPFSRDMVVCRSKRGEYETFTIAFAPHYGGDVRGNYGDYIVLTFKDEYEFIDLMNEFLAEHATTLEIDGEEYTITWTGGGDNWQVEKNSEFLDDGLQLSGTTEAEIKQEIKEKYL